MNIKTRSLATQQGQHTAVSESGGGSTKIPGALHSVITGMGYVGHQNATFHPHGCLSSHGVSSNPRFSPRSLLSLYLSQQFSFCQSDILCFFSQYITKYFQQIRKCTFNLSRPLLVLMWQSKNTCICPALLKFEQNDTNDDIETPKTTFSIKKNS